MNLRCLFLGHDFKEVGRTLVCFEPQECIERRDPFALVPVTDIQEAHGEEIRCTCARCKRTNSRISLWA